MAGDAGQPFGQPFVVPIIAQAFAQPADQPGGVLAILLGGGVLRRGKEERRVAVGQVEEQRGVHGADVAAVGTGSGVEGALADAVGQVGPLGGVDDEPDFEVDRLPAVGTGGLGGLGV